MSVRPRAWAVAFFLCGALMRLALCWSNPPTNAFDDHYEPILMIMRTGVIPAKDACWECYHPPVFYWLSAMIGNFAVRMGVHPRHLLKLLQFIPCVYGILNMGMIYLILRKVPLSDFPRLAAFGTVCFLPRHIYMSAMHSNDTISYLCVSLCIYLLLIAIERTLSPASLVAVTVALTIALFTKYTAYAMLPVTLIAFAALFIGPRPSSRARVLGSCILVFLLPLAALGVSLAANARHYGRPMPINLDLRGVRLAQPRDANRFDFVSFTPWDSIATPMLVPGKMHSFWTMLYRGMWYDTEPKFLYFLDSNAGWWNHYYAWLRGEKDFPGDNPSMSSLTRCMGGSLIILGLLPLLLLGGGAWIYCRGGWRRWSSAPEVDAAKMSVFPALLLITASGIIALAWRYPYYSAVKASYVLAAAPAYAVFLGLGLMPCEIHEEAKRIIARIFAITWGLSALHILHIILSIS
ncbi:MAG: glycosyltransferase family 39 protein [Candidatus Aureabacteria bacterium]|nr:glycosyltransferase family 39 protein [Candidatus Auribacterota bacterium]NLW94212.1 glycosyltransferase family 39 protein [Chlamydiota bacterium]